MYVVWIPLFELSSLKENSKFYMYQISTVTTPDGEQLKEKEEEFHILNVFLGFVNSDGKLCLI